MNPASADHNQEMPGPPEIDNPNGFSGPMLHLGIAEQGKLHAVAGDHQLALMYYRRAMQMTVENGDEEWFFRHYLECVIESLELMGEYDDVLEYCDKAIGLYADSHPTDDLSIRDLAHIHQRKAVILIKKDQMPAAIESLRTSVGLARDASQSIPLAERLLRWAESGFKLDTARILAEQKRERYFTVREDNIDPNRAVRLPPQMLSISPI